MHKTLIHVFALFTSTVVLPSCALAEGSQSSVATNRHYIDLSWTTVDGLQGNDVTSILQTHDAKLWIGTFGGLARFDGLTFTNFGAAYTPGLTSDRILCLHEDVRHVLWICTETGGLLRYRDGRFDSYSKKDGLPSDLVLYAGDDNEGNLWVATSDGTVLIKNEKVVPDPVDQQFHGGAPRLYARDGSVWFKLDHHLVRLHNGILTHFKHITLEWHKYDHIRSEPAIAEDKEGSIWVSGRNGLFHSVNDEFVLVATGNSILTMCKDSDGSILFLSSRALFRSENGRLIPYATINLRSSADIYSLQAIIQDREKNVWIGTFGAGLFRFREAQITTYEPPITGHFGENDFADEGVAAITSDGDKGLWVGKTHVYHFANGKLALVPGMPAAEAFYLDSDKSLWLGYDGLSHFKNGKIVAHFPSIGVVGAIYKDRDGSLWVGAYKHPGGLFLFKDGQWKHFGTEDGLVNNNIHRLMVDSSGALWIGTEGGVSRLKDGKFVNYTNADGLSNGLVRVIYQDADGVMWFGTYGGGLNRFKNGQFIRITTKNGMFDNTVSALLEDDDGNFWIACNRGIYRVKRKELNDYADGKIPSISSIPYGINDGMKTIECNGIGQPAAWKDHEGKLWFSTLQGVAVVDPRVMNLRPPPVVIEQTLADGVPLEQSVVPAGTRELEIDYTAWSLTAPEKLQFKTKLVGFDRDSFFVGRGRIARYINLPPGHYRFQVTASNNDGVWNDQGAFVDIEWRPYIYQTLWFAITVVIAIILLAWAAYKWRIQNLVQRTQDLEHRITERTTEIVDQKNQLVQANELLTRAQDDMLSIFDQWQTAVLTTDAQGQVTFLNRSAKELFDVESVANASMRWDQMMVMQNSDREHLISMLERPADERLAITAQLVGTTGERYWVEVEVKDEPRDPKRKIFFLYDVSEVYDLRSLLGEKAKFHDLVGQSTSMTMVYQQIRDLARVDTSVLISGETGTGKELVAQAIHYFSPRKDKPFIAVNCAGLTESLLASQLFGHKRGAFTGAVTDQKGIFEAAEGGTLFLDEAGDIPLNMQPSLLRVLQEKEITRLGETKTRPVNVRVVAATHRDLQQEILAGKFRQDLLYRIRVAEIHLPPLRKRPEDIPLLVTWFLGQFPRPEGQVLELSRDAMRTLMSYSWPGNVRELKSCIETAVIHCKGPVLQVSDLPSQISGSGAIVTQRPAEPERDSRRQRILEALQQTKGNRAAAARLLGIGRSTLYLWLEDLGIDAEKLGTKSSSQTIS